jgi:hypothetical protein
MGSPWDQDKLITLTLQTLWLAHYKKAQQALDILL